MENTIIIGGTSVHIIIIRLLVEYIFTTSASVLYNLILLAPMKCSCVRETGHIYYEHQWKSVALYDEIDVIFSHYMKINE